MDTSELDLDIQPTYVRVTVRKKILQLALDEEVRVDESNARRLIGSKLLEITMPKVNIIVIMDKKNMCTYYMFIFLLCLICIILFYYR